jgi:hypothetical protein
MTRSSAALSLMAALWLSSAHAQDNCARPTPVDSLDDIKFNYLALKAPRGTYVIDNQCNLVNRREFRKILSFVVLPVSSSSTTTALYIKSYRTFSNNPPYPIKVSRGDGWYLSDSANGTATVQNKLDDKPYTGTIQDWNAAHSTTGTPLDFKDRLKIIWHTYADDQKTMSSTDDPNYWTTKADFDFNHGTLTAYLLRFPSNSQTPIPFNVYLQDQVTQIDLILNSSVEALSGEYKFIIQ